MCLKPRKDKFVVKSFYSYDLLRTNTVTKNTHLRDEPKILEFFNTEIGVIKENIKSTLHSHTAMFPAHLTFCSAGSAFGQILLEYGWKEQLTLRQIWWYE